MRARGSGDVSSMGPLRFDRRKRVASAGAKSKQGPDSSGLSEASFRSIVGGKEYALVRSGLHDDQLVRTEHQHAAPSR